MGACSQTNTPVLNTQTEPCDGVYTPTTCIVHTTALTALGIPVNSSLSDILIAIVASLNSQNILINNLTTQVNNQQITIEGLQAQIDACCL
jgi:hypothetical protein